jgi:hypothetical protein
MSEIKVGDTTSFVYKNRLVPVQVRDITGDFLQLVSLDLKLVFSNVSKDAWLKQIEIIDKILNEK